ncbi:MAG TPA: alpha/beta hydrolase [Acidimicrobiales bacterium]|jgi:pimeloyl-ACP methyl ester carboxylesterase|nr:alpha/beta hydrolase [Acidimicrobiales bacterium]
MRVPSTDGVELELHDLGGDGPALLIAHATGFCAGAYRPMVPLLAERFHVWGVDFRAHGDATAPETITWRGMADDVLAVVDALGGDPILGFGHSMGGASLVGAELLRPGTLERAYLFEPIIIPAEWNDSGPGQNPMSAAARRRRASFGSRDEVLGRYARRPPLGVFRADALAAYVDHGFADAADGTVTLKCTPEHEARTFEAPNKPTIEQVGAVTTPLVIARGERDGELGPAAFSGLIADAAPNAELRRYERLSHFGPFEDPDLVAREAIAFLGT